MRGDLDSLAARGKVHRVRGGAIPRLIPRQEQPFEDSVSSFAAEKVAIGQAAAALLEDGETVLVDVGTTAAAAARAIAARTELDDVVVFTNGLKTALELEPAIAEDHRGRAGRDAAPSPAFARRSRSATLILDQISVKTVLLGCNGVDPIGGRHEHQPARGRAEEADAGRGDAQGRARRREQARPRRGRAALRHRRHRPGDHGPVGRPGSGRGAARTRLRGSRCRARTTRVPNDDAPPRRAADDPRAQPLREPADDRLRILTPEDDDGPSAAATAHARADQTLLPTGGPHRTRRCGRCAGVPSPQRE